MVYQIPDCTAEALQTSASTLSSCKFTLVKTDLKAESGLSQKTDRQTSEVPDAILRFCWSTGHV